MMSPKSCKNCEHSIYDEVWGEFRCKKYERTVYYPITEAERCMFYERGKEKKVDG